MKFFHSLRFRFAGLLSVFIIALSGITAVLGIRQMSKAVSETFAVQGISIVEKAVSLIDGDAFEALIESRDLSDPFYEETRLKLLQLKEFSSCLYICTMAPLREDIGNLSLTAAQNLTTWKIFPIWVMKKIPVPMTKHSSVL